MSKNCSVNRRSFLMTSLAAGVVARAQLPPRRVLILGAGLAGLSAGWELDRAGYDVTILEARTRPGGRVYTLREPFSDGLYAEAGAGRIQDSHEFTLRFVKEFNLTLDPFWPTEGANVTYVRGKRILTPAGTPPNLNDIPLNFSPEERALGLGGSLQKYIFSSVEALGDPDKAGWPGADLKKFEVSIPDFLRQKGASEGLIQMVALGHDLGGMSMLQFLRDASTAAKTRMWYKIRGGNDQLPKAFAAKLADRIVYGSPVVRIEQDDRSVRAICLRAGIPLPVTADFMICALPLPVMRRLEMAPAWSAAKRAAIYEVDYVPMARVFLQSRRRFWLERGETGWASTDQPMDVWDYTRGQPGKRGILGAYTSGRMALELTYRDHSERTRFVLERMEPVHPGILESFEGSASHSWVTDPWSLGAAAEFKQGQLSTHYPNLRTPEGRVFFAGEHTSTWSAWMNGAIDSGLRAAKEIRERVPAV